LSRFSKFLFPVVQVHEMGERKALTKLQPVLEWCRKQQWSQQELSTAYQVVIKTAEALTKADTVVQLFHQMQVRSLPMRMLLFSLLIIVQCIKPVPD
jgi:hypothetical protein